MAGSKMLAGNEKEEQLKSQFFRGKKDVVISLYVKLDSLGVFMRPSLLTCVTSAISLTTLL